jgi:8-oxo-dGTP pyrophosphatase MutT (NUDIX family)
LSRQPPSVRLAEGIADQLRRFLPTSVLRLAFRAGHQVMSIWWLITRPAAIGSKVVVIRGNEMLLVRLTYGARDVWDIPGGTAQENETPIQAAERELYEEVGLSGELTPVGSWTGTGRSRQSHLHGFRAEVEPGAEFVLDEAEIAEARWFEIDDLPGRIAGGSEDIVKASLRSRTNA